MSAVNSYPPKPDGKPGSEARPGEPSMEDILASIRRIIADDQSRQGPALRRPAPPVPHGPQPATPVAQGRAAALDPAAPAEADPTPVATLPSPAAPHANPPTEPAPVIDEAAIDAIASAGAAAILRPSFGPGQAGPTETSQPSVGAPELVRSAAPARPVPAPRADDGRSEPLISPVAAAGIGSSFQALATTVFMQNTAMVETMLRDMLRPMLKTWLDDNLPSIVERLVRTEIERVARGGRP